MEAVSTPFDALLGFVVVILSGAVLRARGRRVAGIVAACAATASVIALLVTVGRQAVGLFVVGGLAGLPVLVAFAWAADQDARSRRDDS